MQREAIADFDKIDSLLKKAKPIVAENKEIRKKREASGDFFNVFSILGMEHYEVQTHSAFLAELLNPKGSHGKKDAYLRLFVEAMPLQDIDKSTLNTDDANVLTEKSTEEGRLDIRIEFPSARYAIVIENKIYAGDQERQLERYRRHTEKAYRGGFTLLYLTLDGREPSEWSTGEKSEKPYWECISYRDNIKKWLQKCAEISGENVKATIRQYIALIDKLTGQEMEDEMSEKLTKLMTDNLDETLAIMGNLDAFYAKVYKKFLEQMKKLAEEVDCDFDCGGDLVFRRDGKDRQDKFICFLPKKYPKCSFGVRYDGGVIWYLEKNGRSKPQKLVCFDHKNQYYPYGWHYSDYDEWNAETIRAIIDGELKRYMKQFIETILNDPNFPK